MTIHSILLEILKISLVATFVFLFILFFKRAVNIGKISSSILTEDYNVQEHYKKILVQRIILKFIFIRILDDNQIKNEIFKISITPEFIKNIVISSENNNKE